MEDKTEQWKPRNEYLHDILSRCKGGAFDEKKGTKHQSRAKAKEEFREKLRDDS